MIQHPAAVPRKQSGFRLTYTEAVDIPYVPGNPTMGPSPLSRFLPPLEQGSVEGALDRFGESGELVLDPFGASPRLAVEAAQAERAVLVAVNNPITRYILRKTAEPYSVQDLQSALAALGRSSKNGGRLEPFMLDLYLTRCSRCEEWISADYFVWDRDAGEPVLRFYSCTHCNHTMEEPTTPDDRRRAHEHEKRGLQHAMALEQLAPRGSPDRRPAEAALAAYPSRAIYAIITLLNKLEQLDIGEAARALMISAMDQANALWSHPEGRPRPLQLIASSQFLEHNVWLALEQAVGRWAMEAPGVPILDWTSDSPLEPGTVTLYAGAIRELAPDLSPSSIKRVLTVVPRPNQAYWTLSALWAAWNWGRETADPIRAALHRRRYDWAWHAAALQAALRSMQQALDPDATVMGFMPDAEPGFLAAALTGFDAAGFRLAGRAVRLEGQAILTWSRDGHTQQAPGMVQMRRVMKGAAIAALRNRGEPAQYALPHAAAWSELAVQRSLAGVSPTETLSPLGVVGEALDEVLIDREVFLHVSRGVEPESGRYWLTDESEVGDTLSDRVEHLVIEQLGASEGITAVELDRKICEALPGLLTPDRRLVIVTLRSYAEYDSDTGVWRLRADDAPEVRRTDVENIKGLLRRLGDRLGYQVAIDGGVVWNDVSESEILRFLVGETANLGEAIRRSRNQPVSSEMEAIVIPGSRAALVAEKARRDTRLQTWIGAGPRVIKFRHIRRLAEDPTLDRGNLLERLALDPPGQEDPQLPLL